MGHFAHTVHFTAVFIALLFCTFKFEAECKEKRIMRSVFHVNRNFTEKIIIRSAESPAVNSTRTSHPWLKMAKNAELIFEPELYICQNRSSQLCHDRTFRFKQRIVASLIKSMRPPANETNSYYINVTNAIGSLTSQSGLGNSSICLVMSTSVRVLKRTDAPFNKIALGKLFPKQNLLPNEQNIKSCAIVSSAGSLLGSKLGHFIDTHDVVMRFNDAPTVGFETDVGNKTTIRILNSQVMTQPKFNFTSAPMFQNITIAAWDPSKYNNTLENWLNSFDYNLFQNYETYRRRYPKSRAFLIDPRSLWRLWDTLQAYTQTQSIRKNPPSSGFIGLAILLPHCPYLNFFEYIPSTRLNGKCHYYHQEINPACTFGAWHPLAAEKLMALDMNTADDFSVYQEGYLHFDQHKLCPKS